VTETLNYISAWVTLLASIFAMCVFFFDLASKKNLFQPGLQIKKSLSLFHLEQKSGSKSHFLVRAKSW